MNAAARDVYQSIRSNGTQKSVVDRMQTRVELYQVLNYEEYEKKADEALKKK
jgi:methylisocitrate lyase